MVENVSQIYAQIISDKSKMTKFASYLTLVIAQNIFSWNNR